MNQIKLGELNLLDVGNSIQIAGLIMSNGHTDYHCYLPDCVPSEETRQLVMGLDDWQKFIAQTDQLETEILAKDKTGKLVKVILRKSMRQIDAGVSWKVFARDGYTCRYCGITGVPLTVDHLVCWEDAGPTTEENLVAACRKCNKLRGNKTYADWLNSSDYKKRSVTLADSVKEQNFKLIETLGAIPRKFHIVSR